MEDEEVNLKKFIITRETEIKRLEETIKTSRKKTLLFQRLPFYKRRRSRSNKEIRRKKSKLRKKDRHVLKTHVWYAKRFKMLKVNNIGLPYERNIKSDKYIYKSIGRGFLFDETYKKNFVYIKNSRISELKGIDTNCLFKIQYLTIQNEIIECILTEKYLIFNLIYNENINLWMSERFEFYKTIECSLYLLNSINPQLKDFIKPNIENVDEKIESDESFYVEVLNDSKSGKFFMRRNNVIECWNKLILLKTIPISIKELQRYCLERNYMAYPFDYVNSYFFKVFEEAINAEILNKYERTPRGKKVEIDKNHLFIWTDRSVKYHIFELEKGSLRTKAFVLQDGRTIGRVIRSGFCFTRGRCRGLCYVFSDVELLEKIFCRNIEDDNVLAINFIKSF